MKRGHETRLNPIPTAGGRWSCPACGEVYTGLEDAKKCCDDLLGEGWSEWLQQLSRWGSSLTDVPEILPGLLHCKHLPK